MIVFDAKSPKTFVRNTLVSVMNTKTHRTENEQNEISRHEDKDAYTHKQLPKFGGRSQSPTFSVNLTVSVQHYRTYRQYMPPSMSLNIISEISSKLNYDKCLPSRRNARGQPIATFHLVRVSQYMLSKFQTRKPNAKVPHPLIKREDIWDFVSGDMRFTSTDRRRRKETRKVLVSSMVANTTW